MEKQSNCNKLLNGYEAAYRGAYEGGATFFGYHSEIKPISFSSVEDLNPVSFSCAGAALSCAFGAALAGKRAFCLMYDLPLKQLSSYSYCGVNGALVIVFCEDNCNIQYDSRPLLRAAHLPIMEPADAAELKRFVKIAYNMSEKYDVPVVVRVSEHLLASSCMVELGEKKNITDKVYRKDTSKYLLYPSTVKLCEDDIIERDKRFFNDCENFPINIMPDNTAKIGIVAAGEHALAAQEALPDAMVYRLGISNPLPIGELKKFACKCEKLFVVEEHPFIETELIKNSIACTGEQNFPRQGRKSVRDIACWLSTAPKAASETALPIRTPDFCVDCSLVSVFLILKSLKIRLFTDFSCTVLSGGFLSAGEVSVSGVLGTAASFSQEYSAICVLNEKELLSQTAVLPYAVKTKLFIVIVSAGQVDVSALLAAFGYQVSICESAEDLPKFFPRCDQLGHAAVVRLPFLCKYES